MKTTNEVEETSVETSASMIATYAFDHGTLNFTIDRKKIREAVLADASLIDTLQDVALKTYIHKTKSRPLDGSDATQWLLDELAGGEITGRFRETAKDREATANCIKRFAMAPDQTTAQFNDNNAKFGVKLADFLVDGKLDSAALTKFYIKRRAADKAEADARV